MRKIHGLIAVEVALLGGWAARRLALRYKAEPVVVSLSGRDQALVVLLRQAKKSVYLRTESLELIPAGNELAQARQRQILVTVDLPLQAGMAGMGSQLTRILMELGAIVTFRSDAALSYSGTYLEVDGESFLYSAHPLVQAPQGSRVSYVIGPLRRPVMGR